MRPRSQVNREPDKQSKLVAKIHASVKEGFAWGLVTWHDLSHAESVEIHKGSQPLWKDLAQFTPNGLLNN